jgi:hypothetical protein
MYGVDGCRELVMAGVVPTYTADDHLALADLRLVRPGTVLGAEQNKQEIRGNPRVASGLDQLTPRHVEEVHSVALLGGPGSGTFGPPPGRSLDPADMQRIAGAWFS